MSETKAVVIPEIGSRWREDYDYGGPEWDRIVEVVGHEDGKVLIRGVSGINKRRASSRITRASLKRFGKSRGYLRCEPVQPEEAGR